MVSRPSNLRALLALAAALLTCLAFSATAGAANVNLHIESLTDTVYNGPVSAVAGPIKQTAEGNCSDDASADASGSVASPIRSVAAWAAANSSSYNTSGGTYLCRIGDLASNKDQYWMMKVNNKTLIGPGDYWLGTSTVKDGDTVLWYYTDDYAKKTLALEIPSTVQTGTAASAKAVAYDGNDDSKSTVSGASVSVNGAASATSGADGTFSLTFPAAGKYLVTATKSGVIRTSEWVTVTDAPVPTQKEINKAKRVAARAACKTEFPEQEGDDYTTCIRKANKIGHTTTKAEKRAAARAKCVAKYPTKGSAKRVKCVRAANKLGR